MSQRAAWPTTDIQTALERAASLVRQVTERRAWYELGWRWLAGLTGLLLIDLVSPLPVWFRWIGLIALASYPIATIIYIRGKIAKRQFPEEHAARMVEEGHPELNNALINAVQFQRVVEGAADAQAGLMRREITRAENAVATTPMDDVVSRSGERRARIILFGAIGTWLLATGLLPGVVFTILPRLFAPWMDDITPPFSLTKFEISPKGASVRFGGALVVNVTIQGPIPEDLALGTRTGKADWTDTPLENVEPGKYAITLGSLRQETWIVAHGGGARSGRYLVKIVMPPVARSLRATYTFPRYTGRKELAEAVGENGIHGLRDTKVNLQVSANRELSGAELLVEPSIGPPEHYLLEVSDKDPKVASIAFPITASGTFHLSLASRDSQLNSDAITGKIVLEHDQTPNVWFNEPPKEIVVTPDMKVGLHVEADDDIGVARIDLHRVINGIADNAAPLYQGKPIKRTSRRLVMDMADLGVRAGDEITYYADAFDNDPGHPNFAETEPYKIKVLSVAEFKKLLKNQRDAEQLAKEASDIKDSLASLAERQQELAETMDKLAKELASKPNDPALKKAMADAQQAQKNLQDEAQQVAKQLQDYAKTPSASAIESALKQKVAEAAQQVAKAAAVGMKAAQSASPSSAAKGAKEAADGLKKAVEGAAKSVEEAIRNVNKVAPLFQDVGRFMALLDRQGQLVLRAREFDQTPSKDDAARSKLEAISAEQERFREELKALRDDLRNHAADAQKDFPKAAASAVKIADEIGRRQIPDLMGAAHESFAQSRGKEGFASAQRALDQMQAMVDQGGACQSDCKGELDIKLTQSLGKPGLGQSLGSCMNPGAGYGNGSGVGSGAGGQMSGGSGTAGGASPRSAVAYTMDMSGMTGRAGSTQSHARRMPGAAAELTSDRIEVLNSGEKKPPRASDAATKGYPPEYRKLIRDYFISVTKEKKP